MELSVSTPFKLRTKLSDQLYYGQYRYCFAFRQPELYSIRKLPGAEVLTQRIAQRKQWESFTPYGPESRKTSFPDQLVEELHYTQDLLLASPSPIKLIISYYHGYVYTNDLEYIEHLWKNMTYARRISVTESLVTRPKDMVVLNNPKYRYRTYFREQSWHTEMKTTVHKWIQAQGEEVAPSSAMLSWLTMDPSNWRWNETYCRRYYYVDHRDEKYITMLRMMFLNIVRKTVPIECKAK